MHTIEIDWEVYQKIEAERTGFEDTPLHALRRLLGLDIRKADITEDGAPWVEDGVVIPHGSEAEMRYQYGRQVFKGQFLNGNLVVNGKSYKTLSQAAGDLAETKDGKKTNLNGWNYWSVKMPGKKSYQSLGAMRERAKR